MKPLLRRVTSESVGDQRRVVVDHADVSAFVGAGGAHGVGEELAADRNRVTAPCRALALAIEVETLSRLYVQALTLGDPPVLSDEEMTRVINQMRRMSYGLGPEGEGANDIARPRA